MEHKLEGVCVELSDLAGAEATDEAVQCYHLCSTQLLRCQVVILSNTLPHRLQLLRQVILISEHHDNQYNSHKHVIFYTSPGTHSSHSGQFRPDRPVRRGASPGLRWRSPELYTPPASPHSHSSVMLGQRPAETHRDIDSDESDFYSENDCNEHKMLLMFNYFISPSPDLYSIQSSLKLHRAAARARFIELHTVVIAVSGSWFKYRVNVWDALFYVCQNLWCENDCSIYTF